jgi:excisionase family DNA binding protein
MNSNETLNVAITGQLTINRAELERLLQAARPSAEPALQNVGNWPRDVGGLARLAFTVAETAEVLGVSPATVYRLLKRGLLRSSSALRHKIIARAEIERFLKETSKADY